MPRIRRRLVSIELTPMCSAATGTVYSTCADGDRVHVGVEHSACIALHKTFQFKPKLATDKRNKVDLYDLQDCMLVYISVDVIILLFGIFVPSLASQVD